MQYLLLTEGEYSSYGVSGLLEGPDDPPIVELVERFHADYLPPKTRTRDVGPGRRWEETYLDIESARARMHREGFPVDETEGYYGPDGSAYSPGSGLLEAWLTHAQGYRELDYTEIHEGSVRT
jgi:hypothetical protein